MNLGRSFLRFAAPLFLAATLSSCGSDEDDSSASIGPETEIETALSGSVGDGPIVDAELTVMSRSGATLENAVSDQNAGYNIRLKAKGKHYPLVVEARGGTDLVTNRAPDFVLYTASASPGRKSVANLNPFSTLAVATAQRMSDGLSESTLSIALETVVAELDTGLRPLSVFNPMKTPVDDDDLAMIVKASETLAEILRRTQTIALAADPELTVDGVVAALAADLVDGALDGEGADGSSPQIAATAMVASAQVMIEAMTNELRVDGRVVTPVLDDVVARLASGDAPELTDAQPVTAPMIAHARTGVAAARAVADSASLETLASALDALDAGTPASEAADVLPEDAPAALDPALAAMASASDTTTAAAIAAWASQDGGSSEDDGSSDDGSSDDGSQDDGSADDGSTDDGSQDDGSSDDGSNPDPETNTPPVISGAPATSVVIGSSYRFEPSASDDDGDSLTFEIQNLPEWAEFDTATGALTGTPDDGHVGTYSDIVISVSDGEATAELEPFAISVEAVANGAATLSWTAPTERTDGSPLTDLAGYRVYWGTESGNYTESVEVMSPGVTTHVVENLGPGTYYFVMTAVDSNGLESEYSNEASKTIE
ncbi:MAG TPA: putative Ig domain-containing protein [Gammaproteobacteria bacterium]